MKQPKANETFLFSVINSPTLNSFSPGRYLVAKANGKRPMAWKASKKKRGK